MCKVIFMKMMIAAPKLSEFYTSSQSCYHSSDLGSHHFFFKSLVPSSPKLSNHNTPDRMTCLRLFTTIFHSPIYISHQCGSPLISGESLVSLYSSLRLPDSGLCPVLQLPLLPYCPHQHYLSFTGLKCFSSL